jgi:LDH2 family malate/lactate/ureidoglycolate dehydrogenase
VLISSDLRGNDSHGVSNMLRAYIGGFRSGGADIPPHPVVFYYVYGINTSDSSTTAHNEIAAAV